jgi:hypothetical protein
MKNMTYSTNFTRDFNWYLKMRHLFNFDGKHKEVISDKNGIDGRKAFYLLDTEGKLFPTKHPNILTTLIKTKGSVNLHVKMYAEDRASGLLPLIEFRGMCIKWKAPKWFYNSVEHQKVKYYP